MGDESEAGPSGDLEEELVATADDHTYSVRGKIKRFKPNKKRVTYDFLYAVSVSGQYKQIKNCISGADAILGNSKKIILGHTDVFEKCLDPRLAEICYMDTDSLVLSLTYKNLEDNILPEMREFFDAQDIVANEEGEQSPHGKMKLEGTFKAGQFKAIKIYRLFGEHEPYTRCKGVNRFLAKALPDAAFDAKNLEQIVVHRSALRPARTGEMLVVHEARSLAVPFNLKRYVTSDGIHTLPISFVADAAVNDGGD